MKLGGPLGFAFSRYYSSALSVAGSTSGLGINWMSNFDLSVSVSGTSAKALLFGGKVVQFTSSGGELLDHIHLEQSIVGWIAMPMLLVGLVKQLNAFLR